jgi:NADH:ubiquinone oxidoreductase subunit D
VGATLVDLGALTNFWYYFNVREKIYKLITDMCGARLTTTYTRIGGIPRDLPPNFDENLKNVLKDLDQALADVSGLIRKNRIFMDRTRGVGVISAEDAISYGFTGPCLRATGVNYDVRKAHPYYHYEDFDFDVPLGSEGDTFDRIVLRMDEMHQSSRIIKQAMLLMPEGPVSVEDPRITLPPKDEVYGSIEGLMNHFMLVINDIRPPPGEIYSCTEAPNGELGFFVISDGTGRPARVRCRPPCFGIFSAYEEMIKGGLLADAIATIGSLNIIVGELDR